jgi:uncharacterized protein (TIGR02001 family)
MFGSTLALADAPASDLKFSGSVGGTTDYVFRGVSQTVEKPAGQATVDMTYKMFYAGIFLSNVDFTGNTPGPGVGVAEIDLYVGVKFPVGRFEFDFGGIYYIYPGANDTFALTGFKELDYFEFKGGAKFKATDAFTLGAFAFFSPESTNKTGQVWTFEGSAEYVFPKFGMVTPSVSGLVGYQVGDDARYNLVIANGRDTYTYWNAGLGLAFGDNFSLDFRYWDTNIPNSAAGFSSNFCKGPALQCDERFVATAKVTF